MKNKFLLLFISVLFLSSCVSKKSFLSKQAELDAFRVECEERAASITSENERLKREKIALEAEIRRLESELAVARTAFQSEQSKTKTLESQVNDLRGTNASLLDRLADLSVVSQTGAESIKNSLAAISQQNKYIQDLTSTIQRKDSVNLNLVMNLKRSLADVNDEDVTVEVKKGVVYISLSDKMLFKSGSAEISPSADGILAKIAKVVNDHAELDILVEGHTDNVPIKTASIKDNWDLSALRATAVVRMLQSKYNVKPERMTAGGRSEFVPKVSNDSVKNKAINRRTEIVILPKLDQFFQLAAPSTKEGK
ncbi:MAG: OmpA family protein [Saprospiraceae bacterium]|nr:OmpA family protein [Saprospiraceae bacterium]